MKDDDTATSEGLEADLQALEAQAAEHVEKSTAPDTPTPEGEHVQEPTPAAEPKPSEQTPKGEKEAGKPAADDPAKPKHTPESERNREAASSRIKFTELERERDAMKAELERLRAAPPQPQPAADPTPEAPAMPPDQVFGALMRANRGEYDRPGQNEEVKSAASRVILDSLTSGQIASVQRAALQGQYGEASGEIADLASKYLPVVQQRERETVDAQQHATVEERRSYETELAQARRDFPAFANKDTDEGKFYREWVGKVFGDGAEAYPKDVQTYLSRHPSLLARNASQAYSFAQSASSELRKLRAEHEALRKKLALKDSPESPSAPVHGDEAKGEGLQGQLEELERKAAEYVAQRGG